MTMAGPSRKAITCGEHNTIILKYATRIIFRQISNTFHDLHMNSRGRTLLFHVTSPNLSKSSPKPLQNVSKTTENSKTLSKTFKKTSQNPLQATKNLFKTFASKPSQILSEPFHSKHPQAKPFLGLGPPGPSGLFVSVWTSSQPWAWGLFGPFCRRFLAESVSSRCNGTRRFQHGERTGSRKGILATPPNEPPLSEAAHFVV